MKCHDLAVERMPDPALAVDADQSPTSVDRVKQTDTVTRGIHGVLFWIVLQIIACLLGQTDHHDFFSHAGA